MVYVTQNYWRSELCPSSCILETRKHNVHCLRLALSKGQNRVGVSTSHLRTETDTVSETLCFLVTRIPDDGQSPNLYLLQKLFGNFRGLNSAEGTEICKSGNVRTRRRI
jgi:hypothetical protein